MKAIIGLGANLGDRKETLQAALDSTALLCSTRLCRVSSFYTGEPIGVPDSQPDYVNCVAELETDLSPHALLGACLGIEASAGRLRQGVKSARTLDIDLLLYEGVECTGDELTLPHPRMQLRAFVLQPLYELYPSGAALGFEFLQYLDSTSDQRLIRLD